MIHGALGGSWCPCWPSSWSLWKSPKPCWRFSCCVAWGAGRTSSPGAVVATATDTGLAGGRCNVKRWGTRLRSNKKNWQGIGRRILKVYDHLGIVGWYSQFESTGKGYEMMMGIAQLWGNNWVIVEYSQHSAVLVFRKIVRIKKSQCMAPNLHSRTVR